MPQVTIKIGSRDYAVACGAGEEPHLQKAAKLLDAEAKRLAASGQVLPENTVLLMSGLMLADQILSASEGQASGGEDAARISELEAALKAAKADVAKAEAAAAAGPAADEQVATLTEERDAARLEIKSLKDKLAAAEAEPAGKNGDQAVLERMAAELERLADEIEAGSLRAKAS